MDLLLAAFSLGCDYMKLFHISDLHLGKRVYEFSMLEEQKELLMQIIGKIRKEKPKVLLITGDIYDKPIPPIEAIRLLDDFLTEVSSLGVHTYLIAGNHDSAQRLEFGKDLMAKSGVFFCGNISKTIVSYQELDEYGELNLYVLPYFKPAHVNGLFGEEIESDQEAADFLLKQIKLDPTKRNIILVHQFVTWRGEAERSDSEIISLGGTEEIDASLFFDFDYAALGHLHSPQKMGKDTVRYAGSLMPYSFSEIRQKKGITVVELKEKGEIVFDFIPLQTKHTFREIQGPLQGILEAAMEDGKTDDYIRCILTDRDALYDPIGKLRGVYPNLMTLEFQQQEVQTQQKFFFDAEESSPDALFSLFFEKQNQKELNETQKVLLYKIWKELEEGK